MTEQNTPTNAVLLPREPIHRFLKPFNRFLHIEAASGFVLLLCAVTALIAANSGVSSQFLGFWKTPTGLTIGEFELRHSLKHWVNDGLMAIFFFVIGLEVKREIVLGELREWRCAALPLAAAIGGMAVPAGLFLALRWGQPGERGWGVPMATDIAFVVGCLAILGRRVPPTLRVLLLSLAIVDDIGAILVIAFAYTSTIHGLWLAAGFTGIGLIVAMQHLGVRSIGMYVIVGVFIWLGFHESGIHATIAGVILGLLTPTRPYLERSLGGDLLRRASEVVHGGNWDEQQIRPNEARRYRRISREIVSPLEYLIHVLHPWVAFVIMPIFALANAGVRFQPDDVLAPVSLAVITGLFVGKPVGILLFSWLALKLKLAQAAAGITWRHLLGGGFLAGIGFTMSLFIAGLGFTDPAQLQSAKVGVIAGSLASAIVGMTILATGKAALPSEASTENDPATG